MAALVLLISAVLFMACFGLLLGFALSVIFGIVLTMTQSIVLGFVVSVIFEDWFVGFLWLVGLATIGWWLIDGPMPIFQSFGG